LTLQPQLIIDLLQHGQITYERVNSAPALQTA
jgi:hypothetical protein